MKKILIFITLLGFTAFGQQSNYYKHCDCTETINLDANNLKNGEYKLTSKGKVIELGNYSNDLKDGKWTVKNSNGILVSEINYSNGKLNGDFNLYYFDGQSKIKARFDNNNPIGEWTYYSDRGKIIKQGKFKNGQAIETWKVFKNNGKKIISEYDFTNNKFIVENTSQKAKKSYLPRDDESGEYIIIYYPDRPDYRKVKPLGGFLKASIDFVDLFNVPLTLMNTYTTFEYKAIVEINNDRFQLVDLKYFENLDFKSAKISLPFIAQTNSPKNLSKIEHSEILKTKVRERIFETLMILGPWVSKSEEQIEIQIPFVLNEIQGI